MNEQLNFGEIFYKLEVAVENLKIKIINDKTWNIYAFEFNEEGKRGYFLATHDLICRILRHQSETEKKMCIYEAIIFEFKLYLTLTFHFN